ncbi:replicative DNA helicase Mcm [Methanococcus maripaludis]|uniref:Replicative DNA helicase Mcm n=1 Tax=Methanococcus maripaludis TaxID=39152 RepID=A0A7J9NYM3_METMI|nr:minichromosome maintenance protein MCM [Methanococcus maripaludis]MBA2850846.1 replicative DNA helicase Mcm [Methanococcus maripaludis]
MVNEKQALTETLKDQIVQSLRNYRENESDNPPKLKEVFRYFVTNHLIIPMTSKDITDIFDGLGAKSNSIKAYITKSTDDGLIYKDESGYLHKLQTDAADIARYLQSNYNEQLKSGKNIIIDFQEDFNSNESLLTLLKTSPDQLFKMFNKALVKSQDSQQKRSDNIIGIENLPNEYKCNIEDINSASLSKLVEFEGIVSIASARKTVLKKAVYSCSCSNKTEHVFDNVLKSKLDKPQCKCGKTMTLNESKSLYIDIQEFKLQQPLETMNNPKEPPKYMSVFFENSPGIYSGKLNIIGIPFKKQQKNGPLYDILVYAKSVVPVEDIIDNRLDENKINDIKRISDYCIDNNIDLLDKLSELVVPTIQGYEKVKKAILLQQMKGAYGLTRNDLHILLVADPGVGKSEILRTVSKLPKNIYGSITGTSGVGLTASVEQEKTTVGDSGWVTKPGLLVCKNGGTASLDELTVNKEMSAHLLEAMESQEIHIAKAGLNISLPAKIAILAACNPKNGRWDKSRGLIDQIELTEPILDRFDLIFDMNTGQNSKLDAEIARKTIRNFNNGSEDIDTTDEATVTIGKDVVDREFLLDFIEYARTLQVKIPETIDDMMVDHYVTYKKKDNSSSVRLLETLIRLSTAFAKARLASEISEQDFKNACELFDSSLKVREVNVPVKTTALAS